MIGLIRIQYECISAFIISKFIKTGKYFGPEIMKKVYGLHHWFHVTCIFLGLPQSKTITLYSLMLPKKPWQFWIFIDDLISYSASIQAKSYPTPQSGFIFDATDRLMGQNCFPVSFTPVTAIHHRSHHLNYPYASTRQGAEKAMLYNRFPNPHLFHKKRIIVFSVCFQL
ncbi:MAG: hypothetical protein CVU46_11620 [Chloroflexi bacterium HGW-Chloroflexi-8]|jgi:hypothetical protein|nr:MAG: hypothetical protein CVU46_11620 [Chloroflexi bacterium HGW-Chloroflexi-8]